MNQYKVIFYRDRRGQQPVRDFIDAQDKPTRVKFTKLFDLLQVYGPQLMMPYARNLRGGMYELRLRGQNEIRIFYIYITTEHKIVLLHAFKKRTQKLPEKELAIARNRQKGLTRI